MGRAIVLVAVIGCSSPDHAPIGIATTPQAIDEQGMPRLVVATPSYDGLIGSAASGKPAEAALAHVTALAPVWGVGAESVPALSVIGEVPLQSATVVRVRQELDGLPIDGGELRVLMTPAGALIAASGVLIATDTPRGPARFSLDDAGAITVALRAELGSFDGALTQTARTFHGRDRTFEVPLAAAKRTWLHHGPSLVAGWIVEAYVGRVDSTHSDLIRVVVDGDGRVLDRKSLVADTAFSYRVFAESTGDLRPLDGPIADVSPHPTGVPDGAFPGFVQPSLIAVDGLNHPAAAAIADPWLAAGRTETQGNNVEAYADLNAPSGLTFGDFRATTTANLTFDRSYDTAAGPLTSQAQQMASITSLFFVINWLHDFWYDAGFTEAAGNAQDQNFGRGGEDRDALLAEAQDNALGGSRNNANMSTPSDGLPPRMQVFLWTGLDEHSLTLQPSGRTPANGVAAYGVNTFDASGELVLADDGAGDNPHDLCEPLVNDVTGKIVLVDRGICTFESKALKIQNAGGVGMMLANNTANTPPTLGDDATLTEPITIAQLSILQAEGDAIKAELLQGTVSATMHRLLGPELDGAVDSTLIAHEFGHYLHHRLQQCNTRMCAAISEGWGDFLSLLLMARDGDDLTGAFPFAVYATRTFSDDAEYFGIRRAPYSIDPAINALSFRHMSAGAVLPDTHPFLAFGVPQEVHNAGEIWTAAMWEVYVALQQARGTASFASVQKAMATYVVGGLLIAPVDGTPTETRDAILIAARAHSQADHDTMAAAFARRGMGSCAVSPDRASLDFTGIVESTEVHANVVADAPALTAFRQCDADDVADAGERGRIVVAIANRGGKPLVGATVTLTTSTPGVTLATASVPLDLDAYAATAVTFDLDLDPTITEPIAGAFELAVSGGDACQSPLVIPISARLNVDDRVSSSATDTFDAAISPWQATFAAIWQHRRDTALDGSWQGAPPAVFSDGALESPTLTAGPGALTMTFEHRYSFETSSDMVFDGGALEYSIDGITWIDVMALVPAIPYGPGTMVGVGNALAGRRGFTATNPSYPATDTVSLDFGTQLTGKMFKLRFRIASDNTNASEGWNVDNVGFVGLIGTPFPEQLPNVARCDGAPAGDAGEEPPGEEGGCCGSSGSRSGALLAAGVLVLISRRRKR